MTNGVAESDVAHWAANALLGEAAELTRIGGGRNSRVYRAACAGDRRYALKLYFQSGQDTRDRRATEFTALQFLHRQGVDCVPAALASEPALGASLLSFIDGEPATAADAAEPDIDQLADFLIALQALARMPGAGALPIASEAVFSLASLLQVIDRRLQRLLQVPHETLQQFLCAELQPTLAAMAAWVEQQLAACGLDATTELALAARTLSPSDFGFHNALRSRGRRLVFVDFEYFGWDDPAKMVSDFLLHPGMALRPALRGRFLARILGGFGAGHALPVRIRVAYVLYALKWCTIVLNEFVPELLQRRLFANPGLHAEEVQRQQLDKARAMLTLARNGQAAFPYENWMSP
jgi:hypothetical protein